MNIRPRVQVGGYQYASYIVQILPRYTPSRSLRPSSSITISAPFRKTSMATSKSFSSTHLVSGITSPSMFPLPSSSSALTLPVFRRHLKHHFFLDAYPGFTVPTIWIESIMPSTQRVPAQRLRLAHSCISCPGFATNWYMSKCCVTYLPIKLDHFAELTRACIPPGYSIHRYQPEQSEQVNMEVITGHARWWLQLRAVFGFTFSCSHHPAYATEIKTTQSHDSRSFYLWLCHMIVSLQYIRFITCMIVYV